ncbi:MAG: hypothetical protein A3C47_04865 [Omnitrophica bacterium RIFCSPHIGHO2_02_FULL_51_18]|nr:MAG: hypothetical protein A3C47_04865 [Omnitrophica bacterium RIFCSPHIGHO2_02_FULL_51_18]
MKKVLIVTLSNIGDAVLTLPVFQSVRRAFPGAQIHAVAGENSKIVFEGDPRIQKLMVYNRRISWKEKLDFLFAVRRERYDLIIDLRHSLLGFFGGARRRNAYFFRPRVKHKGLGHLAALKSLKIPVSTEVSFLETPKGAFDPDESRPLVAAAPGSKSGIKKWPAEYFAKLLDRLALEKNCRLVLVGDSGDSGDCEKIKSLMSAAVSDLSGQTSFQELCHILKSSALVVTNDSAPLHIADSFKTPTLAMFGPTDPLKYGPRGENSVAMNRRVFCSPCERPQCGFQHECMRELGVDEVYAKACRLLSDEFRPRKLNILVVRLDRIGDLVLSLPALEAIRNYFPEAFISVMTRPVTAGIVEGHAALDEVIPYHYEKKGRHRLFVGNIRFLREIIRRRFDICFVLHPSVRSHLIPFAAGIPVRIGFDSTLSFLLTKKVKDLRHLGLKHESEYALDVVRAFGIPALEKKACGVPFSVEHERKMQGFAGRKIIALHPGSSCASKKWPMERYTELVRIILRKTPFKVAVIGGEDEKAPGAVLEKENTERVADLTGRLDIKELAAFLSKCEALVSNDSGPVHIAAGAGTKTLVVFGRNKAGLNRERWKPLGENHRTLQKNTGCVVCLADDCTIDFECLKALGVEEVYGALMEMLGEKESLVKVR